MAEQMQPLSEQPVDRAARGNRPAHAVAPRTEPHALADWPGLGGRCGRGGCRHSLGDAVSLLRLAAAVILADLIWGVLRRIIPASPGIEGTASLAAPSLPYGSSDAPLAHFIRMTAADQEAAPAPWLSWLSGLALTVVLSLLLGGPALLISALAVGLVL